MRCLRLIVSFVLLFATSAATHAQQVSFRKQIAPILLTKCFGCHNVQTAEGAYRMDSFAQLSKAGDSDESPLVPGNLESELLRRITSDDEDERMPAESDPLPQKTIQLIKRWIGQGAKYMRNRSTLRWRPFCRLPNIQILRPSIVVPCPSRRSRSLETIC